MTLMSKLVTAAEMKHYDQFTIQTIGIPSLVLMERASLAVRDVILRDYPDAQRISIVTGSGNNGGDGLCLGRLLQIAGKHVTIIEVGNPAHRSEEHLAQAHICDYYHIPQVTSLASLATADLIVDAIFGIGIDREVKASYATTIEAINTATAPVVAVDVPSGINTDTGAVMGIAVKAATTVTFAFNKVGLTTKNGQQYAGRVIVADDMGTYEN
jgi:NAD(P)H-hydrate epimerase